MNTGSAASPAFYSDFRAIEWKVDTEATHTAVRFAGYSLNLRPQFKGADVCAISASGIGDRLIHCALVTHSALISN